MLFSSQIKTFGLDISDQSLKVAQITNSNYGLQLVSCHKINLPPGILTGGEIKNETELIKNIKKLVNECRPKITHNYVVTCLPETKTFIKLVSIATPDKNHQREEKLNQLIREDLPHHIPLPIENVYFDWQIVDQPLDYAHSTSSSWSRGQSRQKDNLKILIGVAPKETVNSFSQLLKKSGLFPVALEIEAESIIRAIFPKNNYYLKKPSLFKKATSFSQIFRKIKTMGSQKAILKTQLNSNSNNKLSEEQKSDNQTVYFIIDYGASRSGLIAWADKTIQFTTSLKANGNYLTQVISQKLALETNKAEKLKIIYGLRVKKGKTPVRRILKPAIEELCQEIIKAKEFYQNHFPDHHRNYEIILTGGSANLAGLDSELSRQLSIKVNLANPLINLAPNLSAILMISGGRWRTGQKIKLNQKEAQSYATAIGLALRSHFIKDY